MQAAIPHPLPKRVFDAVVAAALLLLFSPVLLVVVAAVAVDGALVPADRGPLLYREQRVSQGRRFELLKFRTLRRDVLERVRARDEYSQLAELDRANLTWVGRRLLKPWYLDELPQLLNVLRGDISLVGPRPWPPVMVEQQVVEGLDYRNRIVAGLTGPAQVTKGRGRSYAELDLAYVEACRELGGWALVRYDLAILRETLAVLRRGEGLNY